MSRSAEPDAPRVERPLPFLGEGANQAFLDAEAIVEAFIQFPEDIPSALAQYERTRLPAATKAQSGSWAKLTDDHLPDGPEQQQDALLAAAGVGSFFKVT